MDFLPLNGSGGSWPQTLYHRFMRHVSYHCAPTELDSNHWSWDDEASVLLLCYYYRLVFQIKPFFRISSLLVPVVAAGLEPLTFWWWDVCRTTVLPQIWAQIIGPRHDEVNVLLLYYSSERVLWIFSLPMVVAAVGLKPFTLGLWDMCPTTGLPQNWTQTPDLGMMRQVSY